MKKRIISLMLIVAMALSMVACNGSNNNNNGVGLEEDTQAVANGTDTVALKEGGNILGEGTTVFPFTVVDKDGNETTFEIHTDKAIVGEALLELNLIAGEEGAYGLYVKTVNGITADYDIDGTYWAFYVNGEYASSGVDTTPITEGESYSFKVE